MKLPMLLFALTVFSSCTKVTDVTQNKTTSDSRTREFVKYTIQKGNNHCDGNTYKIIETREMNFVVKFDSSAIYQTVLPENQYDINKLYGFSDNNSNHHQFSARFGWRWSDKALRLFAYVYNEGSVTSKELTTIAIGDEVSCSIKVAVNSYWFSVNGITTSMQRLAFSDKAEGYQLYPYFGGDETAPHQISIWIKNDQ